MKEHLFFALQPDEDARVQIKSAFDELHSDHPELSARLTSPDRLHVTLHFIGDLQLLPPDIVSSAHSAASAMRSVPFDVAFDTALSFRAPKARPLVLTSATPLSKLQMFRYELGDQLRRHGVNADKKAFTPHITLAYDDHELDEKPVPQVKWKVSEFVLIKSLVGKSQYEVLGKWPIGVA